jgi:hypothetical protein
MSGVGLLADQNLAQCPEELPRLGRSRWNTSMVAYSSGEKTVQNPPGLRKSGMPLATETPAPVSATGFFADRMRAAASVRVCSFIP